ncbi:MAG: vitamin K epoxide reductase family protein [Thermoleophilaceae bacterium]|nr:vitamin K epoxide reductase family protein [Thermoleophilaceae bacterium]
MSDGQLRAAAAAAAGLGLAIAIYLTYVHYAGIEPICATSGGCERVQTSSYAKVAGVPVAVMGLIGYTAILTATLLPGEWPRLAASWLALVGFGFSLYLTYLELFEIDAICQWCVASAVLMSVLAVLTTIRAIRSESYTGNRAA